jgi:leucyl aminopeptidase
MTVPALSVSADSPLAIEADVLVVGARRTENGPVLLTNNPVLLAMSETLPLVGVTGATDELRRLPLAGAQAKSLAIIGVGSGEPTRDDLRYASGSATRQLRGVDSVVIALPTATDEDLTAVLEGAAIGAYSFTEYRVASLATTLLPPATVIVASERGAGQHGTELVRRAVITATALNRVRDLVNEPPSHLFPETLAAAATAAAAETDVSVTVLAEKELAEGGFGGILGVGQGSIRGPRLVKLSYSPRGATKHIALVGKGITFDSGGLSLKQPGSMIGMKYDMTGAATVLAVVLAASALSLPVRLTGWMCLAENLPSGSAARPNDVLRIRGGRTVEYLNTDAEGRLVLADGIVAASEESPDAIIDVATLTGSARIALGNRYVAAMGDEELVDHLVAVAKRVGENFWPMPLPTELRAMLNSEIADIANVKPGTTAAGMLIAGVFLKEFVGTVGEGEEKRQIPWAHLDIAGHANNDGAGYGFTGVGPTGVTVRTLLALAEDFSRS